MSKGWPIVPVAAGWACSISAVDSRGDAFWVGDLHGQVQTGEGSPHGCKRATSATGELTAACQAFAGCARLGASARIGCTVHTDSLYVKGLTEGSRASTELAAVQSLRQCYDRAQRIAKVKVVHVKAHQGDLQNEWVDILAARGCRGGK